MILFFLSCDSCRDTEFGPDGSTPTECRRAARAEGWHRTGGQDLCPECVKKGKQ